MASQERERADFPSFQKWRDFLMKRNRWLTALAAVGIHMSIGSVYAWSVLTRPVMETMGLSLSATTWAFSIAILFLGLSAGFLGPLVERLGPSRSGMVSAVFFQYGSPWDSGGGSLSVRFPALSFLRSHRGHWSWHGLYHACLYACEMVSPASRLCDGAGHHGLWLRIAHRGSGHALSCRSLRALRRISSSSPVPMRWS